MSTDDIGYSDAVDVSSSFADDSSNYECENYFSNYNNPRYYKLVKFFEDYVASALILILVAPLMLLIAILIKLTSKGPVFYRQTRVTIAGKTFLMLKFRSMPVNIENKSGAVWSQKSDDRATIIGKVLRRTSLDELPQFINVLKGEMSLIGPRPERPVFVKKFKSEINGYSDRHAVKNRNYWLGSGPGLAWKY